MGQTIEPFKPTMTNFQTRIEQEKNLDDIRVCGFCTKALQGNYIYSADLSKVDGDGKISSVAEVFFCDQAHFDGYYRGNTKRILKASVKVS